MSYIDDIDYIEFKLLKAAKNSWFEYQICGEFKNGTVVEPLGRVDVVESEGGGEGEGERMHIVIKITAADTTERYFKKTGYYSSYGESEFDGDLVEVWPVAKVVTQYTEERP